MVKSKISPISPSMSIMSDTTTISMACMDRDLRSEIYQGPTEQVDKVVDLYLDLKRNLWDTML